MTDKNTSAKGYTLKKYLYKKYDPKYKILFKREKYLRVPLNLYFLKEIINMLEMSGECIFI